MLNTDGRRSAVVHQYDRNADVQLWVDARFVHVLDVIEERWEAGAQYSSVAECIERIQRQLGTACTVVINRIF